MPNIDKEPGVWRLRAEIWYYLIQAENQPRIRAGGSCQSFSNDTGSRDCAWDFKSAYTPISDQRSTLLFLTPGFDDIWKIRMSSVIFDGWNWYKNISISGLHLRVCFFVEAENQPDPLTSYNITHKDSPLNFWHYLDYNEQELAHLRQIFTCQQRRHSSRILLTDLVVLVA